MNLVIVESPAKSKTIEKYLDKDFLVLSSKGHIRDLLPKGKYGFGIDVDNDFKPTYGIIKGKTKDVNILKNQLKKAKHVYLATDPDREGENIAWHLLDELEISEDAYNRITFHEITKESVLNAIKNPTKIDYDLVSSGETRRFLDRIIGFRLSKLLQIKIGAKSAGRVQSVALKLIVEKEREIEAFTPEEYWSITGFFSDFEASLKKYKDKEIKISSEKEADEVLKNLSKAFKILDVEEKSKNKTSPVVFKTSTLQQTASAKLNFSASKTMKIAQKLYEGIDLKNETVGLITYMRTDSTRVSPGFISDTFKYIEKEYGKEYVGFVKKAKERKGVQDAHEGVRPTSILREPSKVAAYLSKDELSLYELIYYRSLASLMSSAKFNQTTIYLDNNDYLFTSTGSVLTFDGYLKVYKKFEDNTDVFLPDVKSYSSNVLTAKKIEKKQHFTKPPARYNESSLIKTLEELGIGRPSTYATIIDTIKKRNYVDYLEKKFIPTEMGFLVTEKLDEFFSEIINVKYTSEMENDLDDIASAKKDHLKVLKDFYKKFDEVVSKAFEDMPKKEAEKTGETCPECGGDLVIRNGRYGAFVACGNYPDCKYIKKEKKEVKILMPCPKCDGSVVEKRTRGGKVFWGCNNYPKCTYATWYKPTEEICEVCSENKVLKNDEVICVNCSKTKDK